MMPALDIEDASEDAESFRKLLESGPTKSAVEQLFGRQDIASIRVERCHFSKSRPAQLHINVDWQGIAPQWLIAEWMGPGCEAHAQAQRQRLGKSRLGQRLDDENRGIVADTANGLVLRLPGLDIKLPGLRLLHAPEETRQFLSDLEGRDIGPVSVRLVAHRLGKRAVLRVTCGDGQIRYVRLRGTGNDTPLKNYRLHAALWAKLEHEPAIRIPEPLGYDEALGAGAFAPLAGSMLPLGGQSGLDGMAAIARAITTFQSVSNLDLPVHTVADEIKTLEDWHARTAAIFPDFSDLLSEGLNIVRSDLETLDPPSPVLCHRDLHEKQILIDGKSAGLLDFDTMRRGDPALDVGNLLAHIRFFGLRSRQEKAGLEHALLSGLPNISMSNAVRWRQAALLRLAMIHSFCTGMEPVARQLLQEACERKRE